MKRTMATIFALALVFASSTAFANDLPYEDDGFDNGGGGSAPKTTESLPPADHDSGAETVEQDQSLFNQLHDTFEAILGNVLNIVIAVPDRRSTM